MASTEHDSQHESMGTLLERVDHLVYGTPDLAAGIDLIEKRVGVRATPGGQHPGAGTHNALIALGPGAYLEIVGPDPSQPKAAGLRWFRIDGLTAPRLVTWAARASNLGQLAGEALRSGIELGAVSPGRRQTQDGTVLSWRLTNPRAHIADGIVPFFIDWGETPHPAHTAAAGALLVDLRAEHPEAEKVRATLACLGLALTVTRAPEPALVAMLTGPRGRVELR